MPYLARPIKKTLPRYRTQRHVIDGVNPYNSKAWQLRRKHHLALNPLCVRCLHYERVIEAYHADHIVPWKGDVAMFHGGELQSLCHSCHSWKTQQEAKGRYYFWENGNEQYKDK